MSIDMREIDAFIISLSLEQRAEWIKYQLRLRGYSLAALAREAGVGRHAPQYALRHPYPRMESLIAQKLGLHPAQVWPERYHLDGTPKSGRNERGIGRKQAKRDVSYQDTSQGKGDNVQAVDTHTDAPTPSEEAS